MIVGSACSGSDEIDEESVINIGTSGPGTCLQVEDDVGALLTELPVVECSVPHTHEIFAVVLSQETVYPGFDALESAAQTQCLTPFEDYVGISVFDSSLFYSWLVPTLTSWDKEDDRELVCVLGNGDGAPLVGSVKGTGI